MSATDGYGPGSGPWNSTTEAVYDAEAYAWEMHLDDDIDDRVIPPDDVLAYVLDLLTKAGYEVTAETIPKIAFDIGDDDIYSGAHDVLNDTVRLHPKLTNESIIVHELGHVMRPKAGHGPQFCGAHLHLIGVAFGEAAQAAMARSYLEAGVVVNWYWSQMSCEQVEIIGGDWADRFAE